MPKRSTKFYRKNEAEVMEALGLKPTKNSGAGWIEKEDGQNDYLIAQLKSTDAMSIRVQQKDINILEENARICHKTPLFVIQFLNNNDVFIMVRPEDIGQVNQYINTGRCEKPPEPIFEDVRPQQKSKKPAIKSSKSQRDKFHKEREKLWQKR